MSDAFGNDPVGFGYSNGVARKSMEARKVNVSILSFFVAYLYILDIF